MTPEMNWSKIKIDHAKPTSSLNVSSDEELKKALNWINIQPLSKEVRH